MARCTCAWNEGSTKANELIETCRDGEQGCRSCAENTDDPRLQQVFIERGQERTQARTELQVLVNRLGGDSERSRSASAAMHHGWTQLEASVKGDARRV